MTNAGFLVCLLACTWSCCAYNVPWGPSYNSFNPTFNRPSSQEVMVDFINSLGLNLLHIHNEKNVNNIALSPYGAASVLVALVEGSRGEACNEIFRAARIPYDVPTVRVGLRDVHRHLKSYFIPKEGFLAGLTLNQGNVSLNPGFEKILKFYGYDTESFNSGLYPEPYTSAPSPTTTESTREETTPAVSVTTSPRYVPSETPPATEADISTTVLVVPEPPQTEVSINGEGTTEVREETTESSTMVVRSAATEADVPMISEQPSSTTVLSVPVDNPTTTILVSPVPSTIVSEVTPSVIITTTTAPPPVGTTQPPAVTPETTVAANPVTEVAVPQETTKVTTEIPIITSVGVLDSITEVAVSRETTVAEEVPSTTFEVPATVSVSSAITVPVVPGTTDSPLPISTISNMDTITTITLEDSTTIASESETSEPVTLDVEPAAEVTSTSEAATTLEAANADADAEGNGSVQNSVIIKELTGTTQTSDAITSTPSAETSTKATNGSGSAQNPVTAEEPNTSQATNEIANTTSAVTSTDITESQPSTDLNKEITEMITERANSNQSSNTLPTVSITSTTTVLESYTMTPGSVVGLRTKRMLNIRNGKSKVNRQSRSIVDFIIARQLDRLYSPRGGRSTYIPEQQLTFLVNGKYREGNINFMTYDTVLPFHYIPSLGASALSFPLDSTKYYLLLILPERSTGIDDLICELKRAPDLKYIIHNLKYTRVNAVIPSFMLKGYVNLTPTLQKLGIHKIFEPRQADFSSMTSTSDIYVTNIEQAITVTIRNYVDLGLMRNHEDLIHYGPVEFKADRPFLYFVMDSELHVALVAGKVVNPLNSRIR